MYRVRSTAAVPRSGDSARLGASGPLCSSAGSNARLTDTTSPSGAVTLELRDPPDGELRVWAEVNGEERYIGTVSAARGADHRCSSTKRRCTPR